MPSAAEIDVCVASYKRPELLENLLRALLAQETDGRFGFRIAVADNDRQGSAEPVVRKLASAARGTEIAYAVEPEQSVSLARNKSLSLARGDFVATTDDDLRPDRRWLAELHRALVAHEADVVHGPVAPEFRPGTPGWIRECPVFNRPSPPTGSTDGYFPTTANSLFRRALVADLAQPFDPRFGRTGGEDSAFFNRLRARGARMIWSREAIVHGPVPAARANLRWILTRRFRYGNMHPINGSGVKREDLRAALGLVVRQGIAAPCWFAAGLVDRRYRDRGMKSVTAILLHVAFALGIAAHYARFQYEEYRPR
ncbi:MAG TPA: glycosyltransferase [Candidatus Binatia bacterium]|nr:glycosyltransferase [Candidatus Binatia bacterium]